MNIEKRGNKYRITQDVNGIRYRVTIDHKPSKYEAEKLIHEQIESGSVVGNPSDSFQKAAEKYINLKNNILSPWTIRGYNTIIRALSDRFKQTKLSQIDAVTVQKEINDYSATHSPKSVRNAHGFISAVLSTYKPSLHLSTTLPQKAKFEPNTPSEDNVKQILDAVAGTRYEIPYRLACYGMRRGEICAITSDDLTENLLTINKAKVQSASGTWYIRLMPKTFESNRTIYIDDGLADLIRKQGKAYSGDPHRLYKHLVELQDQLGIEHFRFHDFRAYYASMAHALGIPDKYIMANGGWASSRIMDRVYKRTFADKQADSNRIIAEHMKRGIGEQTLDL